MNDDLQLDSLIKKMAQEHRPELPGPGLIWWRAQIQKKLADRERIERPIVIMRLVAAAVCLVIFAAWLAVNWSGLQTGGTRSSFLMLLALVGIGSMAAAWLLGSSASRT